MQIFIESLIKLYSQSIETIGIPVTWTAIVLLVVAAIFLLWVLSLVGDFLVKASERIDEKIMNSGAVKSINTFIDTHREDIQAVAAVSAVTAAALAFYLLEDKTSKPQKARRAIIDGRVRDTANSENIYIPFEKEKPPLNDRTISKPFHEQYSPDNYFDERGQFRIFLSHAKEDIKIARALRDTLTRFGYGVWLDDNNLLPGHGWEMEIQNAISVSHIFLLCLSSSWINRDGYIQAELKMALEEERKKPEGTIFIIPTRLENCEVPMSLKKIQYIDLFKDGQQNFTKLIRALELAKAARLPQY